MGTTLRIGLAALLSAASAILAPAAAQTPLFSDEAEIAITIEAPFSTLVRTAPRSTDPHPATLTLNAGAGAPQSFAIEIAPRGRTRRTSDLCTFPPLMLDFDRDAVAGSFFDGQNKVKLVTHCRAQSSHEQFVVLEYATYRLYNAVTPLSFRVRPARVTYRDTEGRREDLTRFGFLIEDVDDLARRNGREEFDIESISGAQLDGAAAARFALFEYMISNLDWSFQSGPDGAECCHNSKLLVRAGTTDAVTPVPYDFDNSGLVDAPYAVPPAAYGDNVRVRHYRGLCRHNDQLPSVAAEFLARRSAITAVITNEMRLTDARRRATERYLDGFFETISDPARLERSVARECRN